MAKISDLDYCRVMLTRHLKALRLSEAKVEEFKTKIFLLEEEEIKNDLHQKMFHQKYLES